MFCICSQYAREKAWLGFASTLAAVFEHRKHHTREAERLRSLAPTVTTPALKARVLQQAHEHASLAGLGAGGSDMPSGVIGY
jgi:hypothetical protein